VQRLLAFLALQGRPLHRAYVAGRLWIELSQEHAHGCLRSTLWRLGRFPYRCVEVTSTHLALSPGVAVDARELELAAESVLHDGEPRTTEDVECLTRAAELLPDWYDDWVLQERERLRQLRLLALEAAGEALVSARRYSEAAIVALAAVGSDPLRESAYRLLIRAYLGEGNVAEALHQFALFRSQLRSDLGLEPSAQMDALVQQAPLRQSAR
jgi:DNA-binding SARP family transcriptional activator